ncbi:hypothetical protein FHW67_002259 [Herbaspirillum sp. Sphag1AN]|uniref:hypothetical protein n=1 Tax=unclassified Herbaspirillum TaxID=2624150 RepID=UPI0018038513|nr:MULTISPECIES: hypothetical protein [unclassified Herbaspirillum]MBB3212971.1 hypothetical protein [Herbaspirillum sp. Sphag1AN]MBB3246168.1 hypothetical protein [Herbaspirillum sp. Sphag64]
MRYSFPLAFMANTFAVTVLLIALGLAGHRAMAADVGVVQAATLALLYAFSANARSLILSKKSGVSASSVMIGRLLLLLPLAVAAYWLSVKVAGVETLLAVILILRRCVEWIGEVHLSEMERLGYQKVAKTYLALQSVLLLLLLVWLVGDFRFPLFALFLWAILPLFISARFIWDTLVITPKSPGGSVREILPNLGSTAIIGITVYVFRLLILLVMGKETAGDMYTAFAIGGVTGSVFANALGASIALHEQRSGKPYLPPFLRGALNLSLALGLLIFVASTAKLSALSWTGKTYFFWEATGLSMIGGVVMVYAQQIRFRLLQHDTEHDVFGPDVLMNILIFTSVPVIFYMFGKEAMSVLYLLSAVMAYVFYRSAGIEKQETLGRQVYSPRTYKSLRAAIGVLLLLPMFFQISKGVFADPSVSFNSGGVLGNLPIPVSVIACYGGILLFGVYRRAFLSFGYIFLTCILMVMSSIILTRGSQIEQQSKFILLIQLILPMFALVLGQVYEPLDRAREDNSYAKAFFGVLLIIVPIQLIFTVKMGNGYLSPTLGWFSIYQYLQYVPVVFVAAYLLSLFSLWHERRFRNGLVFISVCMSIYVSASLSLLSIILFFGGVIFFALLNIRKRNNKLPLVILLLVILSSWTYFQCETKNTIFKKAFAENCVSINSELAPGVESPHSNAIAPIGSSDGAPRSSGIDIRFLPVLSERYTYWKYYSDGITESAQSLLLGLSVPPNRTLYPSAHNYYLDFIYNFGLIALLPTLFLLGFTIVEILRQRKRILESPALFALSLVVLFLVVVDNSVKVSLRQPYTGIFTFFLWGVLLNKLMRPELEPIISEFSST